MKITAYVRVAKGGRKGYRIDAATTPNTEPLSIPAQYNRPKEFLPTVHFAVKIDVPDELFNQAETVIGELNVALRQAVISNEIVVPKGITVKKSKK